MDFSGQTPSLEISVRVLPSGAAHSRGGRSLLGVGGAAPAPFLAPWQAGMGHSGTFRDIPGHSQCSRGSSALPAVLPERLELCGRECGWRNINMPRANPLR